MRPLLTLLVGSVALAGCGYHPAAGTNTTAPAYQADLTSCHDSAADSVNQQSVKTGLAWMGAPVRRWGQISDATTSCMAGKGYATLRWCTPEELRHGSNGGGSHSGNLVVTASGVQCSDPAIPRKPS